MWMDIEPDVVVRPEPLGQGRNNESRLLVLPIPPESAANLPLLGLDQATEEVRVVVSYAH